MLCSNDGVVLVSRTVKIASLLSLGVWIKRLLLEMNFGFDNLISK